MKRPSFWPLGLVVFTACSSPHASDPHVAPAAPTAVTGAVSLPVLPGAETLPFGSPRSSIDFVGTKRTLSHDGTFESFAGTMQFVPGHIESSQVSVRIQTASLLTPIAKLSADLRSPGFLGVDLFPSANFVSTRITPVDGQNGLYNITGDLSLHGVTHAIQFPAEIIVSPAEVTAHARFVLNRGMFGVGRPPAAPSHDNPRPDAIRDEVVMRLVIRAPRPRPAAEGGARHAR